MSSKKRKKISSTSTVSKNNASPQRQLAQTHLSTNVLEGELCASTYDETLLERARTQWQFGDWESLTAINREVILQHPERSKLALYAAAGHMQVGDVQIAQALIQQAQAWGCPQELLTRILIAGVHNSLGRAAALLGEKEKMTQHFQASVSVGCPGNDLKLLAPVRINQQLIQLGLKELPTLSPLLQSDQAFIDKN